MIEFGKTLRKAREAKGYSISQIAEATHMLSTIIQSLEDEDFSKIVAPIYGRGFVKLYCETVGLDPKPLVDEFMEIYNGKRDPLIRERPAAPEPPPVQLAPEPASAVAVEPTPPPSSKAEPPAADMATLFDPPANPTPEPASPPVDPDLFSSPSRFNPPPRTEEQPRNHGLSKYASPLHERKSELPMPKISLPPNFWRMTFLCVILLALLAAIGFGIRALYRATTDLPSQPQPITETEEARETPPKPNPEPMSSAEPNRTVSGNRTPQDIPSLYID